MPGVSGAIIVLAVALVAGFFGAKFFNKRTSSGACLFLALFVGGCFTWPAYAEPGDHVGALVVSVAVVAFLFGMSIHQAMKGK